MEYLREYFVTNLVLITITFGMLLFIIYDIKTKRRESFFVVNILLTAIVLSILLELELYGKATYNLVLTTVSSVLGYVLRTFVAVLFIWLGLNKFEKKNLLFLIPVGIALICHGTSFFIGTPLGQTAVWFSGGGDQPIEFHRSSILGYASHICSAILLVILMYISLRKVRVKRSFDSYALVTCTVFVTIAVLIEMLSDTVGLLNNIIGVSCIFFYLFTYKQDNRIDQLTKLFDRKSFYLDEERFGRMVNCVIHIDMNGLKALNDDYGHEAGDIALAFLGKAILDNIGKNMYAYRLGGDEFVILCIGAKEENIQQFINQLKDKIKESDYSASMGYAFKTVEDNNVTKMLKVAEVAMYSDKEEYYRVNHIERRRR